MFKRIILLLISFCFSVMLCGGPGSMGRPPQTIDHTACQVQMSERLNKIQEEQDPNAGVFAYYNKSGIPCKTYCRFKSANFQVGYLTSIIDSPYYILCAKDRYCSKGGKCKKIGTPLKLDDDQTTDKESQSGVQSTSVSSVTTAVTTAPTPAPTPAIPVPSSLVSDGAGKKDDSPTTVSTKKKTPKAKKNEEEE